MHQFHSKVEGGNFGYMVHELQENGAMSTNLCLQGVWHQKIFAHHLPLEGFGPLFATPNINGYFRDTRIKT